MPVTIGGKILLFLKDYWSHILVAILCVAICWFVWSWYKRGQDIADLKESLKSKQAVVDLTSGRQVREVEISNDTDKKIESLEKEYGRDNRPMSPAVRAAIDSLY